MLFSGSLAFRMNESVPGTPLKIVVFMIILEDFDTVVVLNGTPELVGADTIGIRAILTTCIPSQSVILLESMLTERL